MRRVRDLAAWDTELLT